MSYSHPEPRGSSLAWLTVAVIVAGFIVGALGLILGPTWWLFWVGAGIVVVGGVMVVATDLMSDVEIDQNHGPAVIRRSERRQRTHEDPGVDRTADDPYGNESH